MSPYTFHKEYNFLNADLENQIFNSSLCSETYLHTRKPIWKMLKLVMFSPLFVRISACPQSFLINLIFCWFLGIFPVLLDSAFQKFLAYTYILKYFAYFPLIVSEFSYILVVSLAFNGASPLMAGLSPVSEFS